MVIHAKDNLTKFAYQSKEPKTKSYTYDWFQVVEIDSDSDSEFDSDSDSDSEFDSKKEQFGSVDWEEARQYFLANIESIDKYNEDFYGGHNVIQLRIEGLVYN